MKRRLPIISSEYEEAVRVIFNITASIEYALNELLRAKTVINQIHFIDRLDEDRVHLKNNLSMLRQVIVRPKVRVSHRKKSRRGLLK